MADKTIQSLPTADALAGTELFVLQQNGAKKIEAQAFIAYLTAALNGHGGIDNISYTPPAFAPPVDPSLNGTLTVTTADGTEFDFDVTNGRGISNITWTTSGTAGDGMTHTGTIAYNDGSTSTVEFQDGVQGPQGQQTFVWFKWAQDYPSADSDMQSVVGPYIGIYAGISSTPPTSYTEYTWYEYKGETGDAGSSILSIDLTSASGLQDIYTITLTDGNTSNFTVTNAKSIVSVTMVSGSHAAGTTDVYQILFNDGDTANFSVYNGANGLGSVSTVSGIQADGNGDVPQVISGNGAPTTATVGQMNQLYYDLTNSVLYYCAGESGGTYVWLGAGVTVDSALSGSSENPVQNKVITGRVGTGALPNSNTNLTEAINYVDGRIPTAATQTPLADTTGGAVGSGTNWARNDHKHPLNVATSGVPADLGTAANGSSANYARQDHVHNMPSASDVGAVSTSDVQYKVYDSVADLGLTSGSATISGTWTALRAVAPAMLICPSSEFSSTQRPEGNGYGTMVLAVSYSDNSVARGWVEFHGYGSGVGDYRMFLSSSTPSGTWVYASANWKSMWTNDSPSSNFSSDTIPLDLSPFSEVMIVFNATTSSAYTTTFVTPIDGTSSLMYGVTSLASATAMSLAGRYVSASSTGVTINAARVKPFSSTAAGATDNSYFIPFKIYAR